jgi:hypothetical protein
MRRRHRLPTRLRGDDRESTRGWQGETRLRTNLSGRRRKPASRPALWLSLIRELGRAKAEQRRQSGSYRIVKSHQYTRTVRLACHLFRLTRRLAFAQRRVSPYPHVFRPWHLPVYVCRRIPIGKERDLFI